MKQWLALFEGSQASPACPSDISRTKDEVFSTGGMKLIGKSNILGKTLIAGPIDPIQTSQGLTSDRTRPSTVRTEIDCRPEMHLHNTN
jgi:hypothetical protein